MCALWANVDDGKTGQISLAGYDIVDGALQECPEELAVSRIYTSYSAEYYDKRVFPDDVKGGILAAHDGREARDTVKKRLKPVYNNNILGYMVVDTSGFDNPDLHACLLSAGIYNGNGFYLRKDNYLEKLPMFCASRYITYNRAWTERARIMKSADGAVRFFKDAADGKLSRFLLQCLLFTCLETQNHMRTFTGSDGRLYRNELCLDGTNGDTVALRDLSKLAIGQKESALFSHWGILLQYARQCGAYDPSLTYGVYQIFTDFDTSHKDEATGNIVWDHVELHTALGALKSLVKEYYNTKIVPVLFEYEFLK